MKTRVLSIKLGKPLRALLATRSKTVLAGQIGVSPQKLNGMMNDDWEYITRDAIERAADYLGLEASELFDLQPIDFWKPIEEAKIYTFLRGSARRTERTGLQIPRYDDEATVLVKSFLRNVLPEVDDPLFADHLDDEREILRRAKEETCIVIGSPKSNVASEILLSRFFGAEPFNPSLENRKKIPFGFCWGDTSEVAQTSSLACSSEARKVFTNRLGIALSGGIHVRADYHHDGSVFRGWQTQKGADCGFVFVANSPFKGERPVKLIVLAGFSGTGTLGAARALIEDFRYLEPLPTQACVYGIVEVRYTKEANTTTRKLKDIRWRCRRFGHSPIRFKKDKERANQTKIPAI